jgi:alpha-tubulin suppressor-like RCC1 family protein
MYTTGSSEFGQLGNGETGEHFITASKIGFTNCSQFTRQSTFCHAPNEVLHSNSGSAKVVPLAEDIRIQDIACGKHHCVALEANNDQSPRVFTWGCGNYGVLGHGVQSDEFFPRQVGALQSLPSGSGEMSVGAGGHCSLLKTSNGHVYYWGKHRSVGEATMRPTVVDALANNQHIVSHCAAGAATVVCTTQNAVTVSWGQGPHGELGLGDPKSSAKPTFVATLDGCRVADLACGYGHTLFVVREDDAEDIAAVKKLPELDMDSVEGLVKAAEEKVSKKK